MKNNITKMENSSLREIPEKKASNEKHFLALVNITSEVEPIMEVAVALARKYTGEITSKNFMSLPFKTPASVDSYFAEDPLKNPWIASKFHSQDLNVASSLVLSYDRKKAIVDTIIEEKIDFVIGGFQGYADIYKNLRNALAKIPTDTLCLRFPTGKKIAKYSRILVPLLVEPHTPLALAIACDLAEIFGQELVILHDIALRIDEEPWGQILNRLEKKSGSMNLERIPTDRKSIISSVLKEYRKDTWLVLPALRSSWRARFRPGYKQRNLLKEIVRCSDVGVMIIKKTSINSSFKWEL